MSTTNDIVNEIQVPSLSNPQYAEELSNAFNDINNNFTTLANHDFVKGEAGTSVSVFEEKVWDNVYTNLGEKLINAIKNGYESSAYSEIDGTTFDKNLKNANVKLHMIKNGNGDYISSLYFVFLDARFAQSDLPDKIENATSADGNNKYSEAVDLSCVLIYDKTANANNGGFVRLENAFPTMYYVPSTGMCWKLYGEATGIPVAGLPGQKGQSSSINIVKCNTFKSKTESSGVNVYEGTVTSMFVNGAYKSNFTDADIVEYTGQTVLAIAPVDYMIDDQTVTKTDMFFGVLSTGEDNSFTVTTTSTEPWTGYVEEAAVVNLFRNINIYKPNLNSSDTIKLPGLFVPIASDTNNSETGQPAHLITATNINGEESNNITPDLIIAPVNNVDEFKKDSTALFVERKISIRNDSGSQICYEFTGVNDNNNDKYAKWKKDEDIIYTESINPTTSDTIYDDAFNELSTATIIGYVSELKGFDIVEDINKKGALCIVEDVNIVSENGNEHHLNVSGNILCNGNIDCCGENLRSTNIALDLRKGDFKSDPSITKIKSNEINFIANKLSITNNDETTPSEPVVILGNKEKTLNDNDNYVNLFSFTDETGTTENFDLIRCNDEDSNKILTIDNDGLNIFKPTDTNLERTLNLSRNGNINCKELTVDKATIKGDTNITGVLKVLASSNPTKVFEVNGGNVYGEAFYQRSDNRLKDFGETVPVDLDKLKTLKKNYFTWKDGNKDIQIGVSAQEIQEIYPELVSTDKNGMLSVAYDKLSVVALAAVDKLHDENKALEKRIKDLEDKFETLLSRINY